MLIEYDRVMVADDTVKERSQGRMLIGCDRIMVGLI
jgi:hypothetical protein